jgi:hypothetical protein
MELLLLVAAAGRPVDKPQRQVGLLVLAAAELLAVGMGRLTLVAVAVAEETEQQGLAGLEL